MKKNKILTGVFVVGCVVVIGVAGVVTVIARNHFGNENLICDGIKVGSVDVSGMTKEEAQKQIDALVASHEERKIVVQVGEHEITTTCQELGLTYEKEAYAEEALAIGKEGNLWERYQEIQKAEDGKMSIELNSDLNDDTLRAFVEEQCAVYDVKSKNSKLKYENGKLIATESRIGHELQIEETVELLKEAVLSEEEADQVEVTAVVETVEPEYLQEEVSKCTNLLGSYSTTYNAYQTERSTNVATATGRINGTILYPGETFSTVKVIKDRTIENGYKTAPEYSSGKVIDGIGGGVCQVSTTLYNAVINAELEIVERSPHSMVVSYVDVSRDAAIAGDYKDFKFKNNSEYPIYLMGSAYNGVLSFKVYGYDQRPANRTISFVAETTATIEPGKEVVTEDPSLPEDYREVTQSAHVGYRAKLWKIVKVDGVQTEKVQINSSSYSASPQYVTVGKQKASPSPKPGDKNKDNDKSKATKAPKATPKPKETVEPKVTEQPEVTENVPTETEIVQ